MKGAGVGVERCKTPIDGAWELIGQVLGDSRGAFSNIFRAQEHEFEMAWQGRPIAQVNVSLSKKVGTIRGLHYQASPFGEAKLVRCLKGKVWDVAVDLRPDSPSYGHWHAVTLSPEGTQAMVIPEGCAHGFQVLEPDSELLYLHSGAWVQAADTGVRWDDPQLAIPWPLPVTELSDRDRTLPCLGER